MLGRNILVHRWQVVLFILGVQVVVLAVTGVSSPGEALAYLASACLIGVACFHAAVLSAGRRWLPNLVVAVAAGLLAWWIPLPTLVGRRFGRTSHYSEHFTARSCGRNALDLS